MTVKVFILGRPGSGKSAASYHIASVAWSRGCFALRHRDYELLMRMFQADTQEKFKATDHGGFDVLDFSLLDAVLKDVAEQTQMYLPLEKRHVLLIEFARDDYRKALKLFDQDLLKDAHFLFIEADVETCIQRIHERVVHPLTADDFFVSDHILKTYYAKDNREYISSRLRTDFGVTKQIEIIDNMGSQREFLEKVRAFARRILEQEI